MDHQNMINICVFEQFEGLLFSDPSGPLSESPLRWETIPLAWRLLCSISRLKNFQRRSIETGNFALGVKHESEPHPTTAEVAAFFGGYHCGLQTVQGSWCCLASVLSRNVREAAQPRFHLGYGFHCLQGS